MKRAAVRIAVVVLALTLLLLALVITVPGQRSLFVGIYELVLGAVALAVLVRAFRPLEPQAWQRSAFERSPERGEPAETIPELERIDRLVVLGSANSFDLHYRLRPLLRELARERLHASHGVDLDRQPERARPLLGEELWEIVRPERELKRRSQRGLPAASLEPLVRRLETL